MEPEQQSQQQPASNGVAAQGAQLARAQSAELEGGSGTFSPFAAQSVGAWELANRMATALAASSIVPEAFVGKNANCMIAMEYAARLGVSVLAVMQNLDIIHGKPGLRSTFLIGSVNSSNKFTPLRFVFTGTKGKNDWACYAVARDRATGELLEGEPITWEMAVAEGWVDRKGSKWKTMPGQMMRYRAASFWTRVYCPEISLGFKSADELEDIGPGYDAIPGVPSIGTAATLESVIGTSTKPAVVDAPAEAAPSNDDMKLAAEREKAIAAGNAKAKGGDTKPGEQPELPGAGKP